MQKADRNRHERPEKFENPERLKKGMKSEGLEKHKNLESLEKLENLERLERTAKILPGWYQEHARDLPWRRKPDAYHVWISEIMLQQTRVEAVRHYYARFLEALPTLQDLAACEEDRLLKLWEGLGYYSRARNLQKAARVIMEEYGGQIPADHSALLGLPGIGPYTAGAVASIAFGIPRPAVDGNVLRVISRLLLIEEEISAPEVRKSIEKLLQQVIPEDAPGQFNQAMMEIGATVCVPNGPPKCAECPLRALCLARLQGRTEEIPVRKKKPERRIEERTVLIIRDPLYLALSKRPAKGLLAGMYELPSLDGTCSADQVLQYVSDMGLSPVRIRKAAESRHIFTHIEWRMTGYLILVEDMDRPALQKNGWIAVKPEQTQSDFPVPSAFSAYASDMNIKIGYQRVTEEE